MNNRKKVILLIGVLLLLFLIVGFSYAYYALTPTVTNTTPVNVTFQNGVIANFTVNSTADMNVSIPGSNMLNDTTNNVAGSDNKSINVTLQSDISVKCTYDIYFSWNSNTINQYTKTNYNSNEFTISGTDGNQVIEEIQVPNYNNEIKLGEFSIMTSSSTTTQTWNFNANFYNINANQDAHADKIYSGKVDVRNAVCNLPELADVIENTNPAGYRGSSHNDSATQNMYRFTGTYQSSDSAYAGNVDNYICLGTDTSPCPENNKYRIIGIVAADDSTTGLKKNMIKVIKNTNYGNYTWDGATSYSDTNGNVNSSNYQTWVNGATSSSHDASSGRFPLWQDSYLNTNILNQTYLNSMSSISSSIASVKWHCYVGGSIPTAAQEYAAPLCSNTSSKISIISVSDYIYSYNNGVNSSSPTYKGWLGISSVQYTMANLRFSYYRAGNYDWRAYSIYNFNVQGADYFYYEDGNFWSGKRTIRPVFYLNDNILYSSGTGTYANPYYVVSPSIRTTNTNNVISWDPVSNASSYDIYVDGVLKSNTSSTSVNTNNLYQSSGNHNVVIKAKDSSNNIILESNPVSYTSSSYPNSRLTKSNYYTTAYETTPRNGNYYRFDRDDFTFDSRYFDAISENSVSNTLPNNITSINLVIFSDLMSLSDYSSYSYYTVPCGGYYYFDAGFDIESIVAKDLCLTNPSVCTTYSLNNFDFTYNGSVSYNSYYCYSPNNFYPTYSTTISKRLYYDSTTNTIKETSNDNDYYPILLQFVTNNSEPSNWEVFTSSNAKGCLLGDTDVYVYDRKKRRFKKKKIKDVDYDDELLAWDFDNGCFTVSKPVFIMKKHYSDNYISLKFSDGSVLNMINNHRIFNKEAGKFTPSNDEVLTPIGTTTFNASGEFIKLVSKKEIKKRVDYYNVITNYHINLFTGNILTSCRLNNIYPIENMKFIKDNRKLNNKKDFVEMSDEFFTGLRIAEQPLDLNRDGGTLKFDGINEYIERMKDIKK